MLTLIRGLPGSGKSTYAMKHFPETIHLEADMFHIYENSYKYDITKVKSAHQLCQRICELVLHRGNDVVISNIFTTHEEMKPYLDMAESYGVVVNVITLQTQYGTIHHVPKEVIEKMKIRWQDYNGEIVIK